MKLFLVVFSTLCLFPCVRALPAFDTPAGKPKVGLALSGGGAKGLAHIGVLKILEEAGIKVDYISGTSMGSIIGALYAIGYDAESLEKMAMEQDWEQLLTDEVSRRSLSIEEKEEDGKYVGSFPIREGKIGLPTGLVAGQKLAVLISRLTLPVHHTNDFNAFPIPFLCVATDLETGEAVVFDKGFLPDVLRASMSIPSIFTPVEIDGRLLVDGGLVNNFPVSDVRRMGADIVIGVDVTAPLYKKEELNSLIKVMEQSISFRGSASTEQQQKLCDILIRPDIEGYTTTSFKAAESLIAAGERSARALLDQLEALSDSLNKFLGESNRSRPLKQIRSFYITELRFEGLENVSEKLLTGKLGIKIPMLLTPEDVEKAIERAYGTYFFERITYKIEPAQGEGTSLVLRVTEKMDDRLQFGVHYDSDSKAAVLLNTTFRNILVDGSRLLLNAKLSDNPAIGGFYFVPLNFKPIPLGIGFRASYWNYDVIIFKQSGEAEADLDYSALDIDLFLQTIFSNYFALGAEVQYHHASIETVIAPENFEEMKYGLVNFLTYLKIDNFDRSVYPRSGLRLYLETNYLTDLLGTANVKGRAGIFSHTLSFTSALPVHEKVSILGSIYGGTLNTGDLPGDFLYYVGGAYTNLNRFFPFVGLKFMERSATTALILQTGVQFEFGSNKFLTLKGNIGQTEHKSSETIVKDSNLYGLGLSIGWLSPIGPMEYTVMSGSERNYLISSVNIGYRF